MHTAKYDIEKMRATRAPNESEREGDSRTINFTDDSQSQEKSNRGIHPASCPRPSLR